jgi:two-component system OmpR family sensor kinase
VRQLSELRHLGQLIESFLVMTRIEAGEQRHDAVHLDDVVRRARLRCLPAAERKAVRLELDCPATPTERDPIVRGDAELLQALVENLVRNAIRHSPRGAAVAIGTRGRDEQVQVFVTDEGPGVPEDIRNEIFKRGVGMRTDEDGFGLGLSIVDTVARIHDGIITLKESQAGGCSFQIDMPAAREDLAAGSPAALEPRRAPGELTGS